MSAESLLSLSAVELRRRIGTKEVSPVELLEACIDRIEAVNPAVNAISAKGYRRAREEAKAAEAAVLKGGELGPLHGLPLGVKDLQDTEGLLTTHGSPLYRDNVPKKDSAQIALARKGGAIVTAKTNVPEFGAGANSRNPVWGATGNPFNPTLNAGGSSGGSAAALACDMLPICTGSDTGGSLRIPAAICGIVGFRPSPGLVPMDGRGLGWTPISVLGPMGRNVADTRLLFASQVGVDDRDPLSQPVDPKEIAAYRPVDLGTLRVAWSVDFGQCPVSSEIKQVMRDRMKAMGHLFKSCDELTFDFGEADRCFDVVRGQSYLARYHHSYNNEREKLGPNIIANYELAASMSLADAAWAHTEQTSLFRRFQALYREYDLILAPTTPVSPFPWTQLYLQELEGQKLRNYYHWLALTYFITLTTNPAISLPCGVDAQGMPFGLQAIGRFRGDLELLNIAQGMEQAFAGIPGLGRPKPDMAKLRDPRPELKSIVTAPPAESA
ncbi:MULTISPECIES: amidase [Oceanibaculum]|uniref:Amidase n=1 Tax=Oceanibaculum indicum P24 TaxID=1207063 RepID=K2K646_9PROT|nr:MULTISPECIES: amidase family protein [Oceanibaculum]EKE72925.1 amidase [Oceanibaculum indicum P24]MCH2394295.1 amidase family protein [Oceanibaculum sp.]